MKGQGAWIAAALLGAFALFEWAESKSVLAAQTTANTAQPESLDSLINSLSKLIKGGGSSGGSSGGAGSGASGASGGSSFGASGGGSQLPFNDTNQYVAPINDTDTSLISEEQAPGDFQVASQDYTPPVEDDSDAAAQQDGDFGDEDFDDEGDDDYYDDGD